MSFNRTLPNVGLSLVDYLNVAGGLAGGANVSYGKQLWFLKPCSVRGIRTYWVGGVGAKTLKLSLWNPAGTRVATADVNVNAAGVYQVLFSSEVAIAASDLYKNYVASSWVNDGSALYTYTDVPTVNNIFRVAPSSDLAYQPSPYINVLNEGRFHAGDAFPDTTANAQFFPVEPVISLPTDAT